MKGQSTITELYKSIEKIGKSAYTIKTAEGDRLPFKLCHRALLTVMSKSFDEVLGSNELTTKFLADFQGRAKKHFPIERFNYLNFHLLRLMEVNPHAFIETLNEYNITEQDKPMHYARTLIRLNHSPQSFLLMSCLKEGVPLIGLAATKKRSLPKASLLALNSQTRKLEYIQNLDLNADITLSKLAVISRVMHGGKILQDGSEHYKHRLELAETIKEAHTR